MTTKMKTAKKTTKAAPKAKAAAPKAKAKAKAKTLPAAVAADLDAVLAGQPVDPIADAGMVDVTAAVLAAIEDDAKAAAPKAKRARKPKAAPAPVVVEETTPDVVGDLPTEEAETKAAGAVYAYAERLGIDVEDVVRIAKACEEYDMLVGLAGMEITDRVVWLARKQCREFDDRVVRPNGPKTTVTSVASAASRRTGERTPKADGGTGKGRVTVFGFAATAVIRALRATCGMKFAEIRAVLDACGGADVADATIRAQMAGGGLGRGEPAVLSADARKAAEAAAYEATGFTAA